MFFEKPTWPKKLIYGTISTPKKAYERAYLAGKKPKIHQSTRVYKISMICYLLVINRFHYTNLKSCFRYFESNPINN